MIQILPPRETQEILKKLNEQFGIKEIPGKLIKIGKDRIFLYQGEFSEEQIKLLEKITEIERLGIYIGRILEFTNEFRLSIEGTQIFKNQITKNIYEMDDKELEEWMKGKRLKLKTDKKDLLVMKHNEDYLGCGNMAQNFIPKTRRL